MTIKIFEINDTEWWAGDCTPEQMLIEVILEYGSTHEEVTGDINILPRELTDHELNLLVFEDESMEVRRSYREQLQKMIDDGETFPCLFATTEY